MKSRMLSLMAIFLMACGSTESPEISIEETNPAPPADSNPIQHIGVDVNLPRPSLDNYNPCLVKSNVKTKYARLTEHLCTDSNGVTYSKGYWDSFLNITCHWNTAADLKTHCLPDNVQTSPVYADGACEEPIALVQLGAGPYIGLEHSDKDNTWVNVYVAGEVWDSPDFYYKTQFNGELDCFSTRMLFPGFTLRYVGVELSPALFVEE